MSEKIELMSPLRLVSYRDNNKNNQIFQWVIGEYEEKQLSRWESIVDGSSAVVNSSETIDYIKSMLFTVTRNTTEGNSILTTDDPETHLPTLTNGGLCVRGGDLVPFDNTSAVFDINSLFIYKNGTRLIKGSDVSFVALNQIRIASRLQVGDTILIEQQVGI